ncbi:LysE family translocator [Vibrio ostreicida]|uniref:LysE family translocator n=1 Tax=Vibrio ostreicida TaxID=526588 RepID=A0ABT8BZM0_9VIBR|nr:LysE family translocator [Vibrio ostreicida]MDN3611528.1 LysE family translocator [Vibrio ostreicida]NPD09022.1 LysE family translocator [Vibrio ostreicida]
MESMSLAVLGILIVISPGADFVLVLKNSLNQGRVAGIWTAIGVSIAISVHIGYSMLGISYLISQNEWLFGLVRYIGSAYLIYLGLKGIFSASTELEFTEDIPTAINGSHYLAQGFLCNVLNPKTMLFFLSIFSQVISPDSSNSQSVLIYGLYMIMLHGLWFSLVAILFTSKTLQVRLKKMKKRLNQACGAGLLTFGALLALKS